MKALLTAALLTAALPADAATIETATGDWSALPVARIGGTATVNAAAVDRIHKLVSNGTCTLPGQSKRRLDMTVPFLIRFAPDGSVDRVVLQKLGCAEAEGVLGTMLLRLVEAGNYKPTGKNPEGWYRSELSFSQSDS